MITGTSDIERETALRGREIATVTSYLTFQRVDLGDCDVCHRNTLVACLTATSTPMRRWCVPCMNGQTAEAKKRTPIRP